MHLLEYIYEILTEVVVSECLSFAVKIMITENCFLVLSL